MLSIGFGGGVFGEAVGKLGKGVDRGAGMGKLGD